MSFRIALPQFVRRRSGYVAIITVLLLSLVIPNVNGQQALSLSRQGKATRTRSESERPSPDQKTPIKPITTSTELTREDFIALRKEQIDRMAGRTPGQKLISKIERGWQPTKTNAVTRSVNQELQATPQTVVPKGSETFNLKPVVTNQSVVPGSFNLGDFGHTAAINDSGDIVFITGAGPFGLGTGLYKVNGNTVSPLALANQRASLTGGGHFLGFLDVSQTASGSIIIFSAAIEGGITSGGLFKIVNNEISPIALSGQQIGNDQITGIGAIAISSNGNVAFTATVATGTAVFKWVNNQLSLVAHSDQFISGVTGGASLTSVNAVEPPEGQSAIGINNSGTVVFTGSYSQPNTLTGTALLKASTGTVTAIANTGQPTTPGTPLLVYTNNGLLGQVLIDDTDRITFSALYFDILKGANRSGIFAIPAAPSTVALILSNTAVPGVAGSLFDGGDSIAFKSLSQNTAGKMAFVATFSDPSTISAFNSGIFSRDTSGTTALMVRDFSTGSFKSFAETSLGGNDVIDVAAGISINSGGTVAFTNQTTGGTEGVFSVTGTAVATRASDQTPLPHSATLIDFHDLKQNNAGSIAFSAAIVGSVPGIFLSQSGNLTTVAMTKGTVPGVGARFNFLSSAVIDNNNRVVITGGYNLGNGVETTGVFSFSGGSLTAVAVQGQTASTGKIIRALSSAFGSGGQILLLADISVDGRDDAGEIITNAVLASTGGSFSVLTKGVSDGSGDVAPGAGAKFTFILNMASNGSDAVFTAFFAVSPFYGMFQLSGGAVSAITIPPTPTGRDNVFDLAINSSRKVAYSSTLDIGKPATVNDPGLYSAASGVSTRLVTAGDQLAGFADKLLPVFLSAGISDAGKIVFTALHSSSVDSDGTFSFNDERNSGISTFIIPAGENPSAGGHVSLVATTGSEVVGTPGFVGSVLDSDINPNGNIIVAAAIQGSLDITDAILTAQPNQAPTVQVVQPATGDSVAAGMAATIKWIASDDVDIVGFDLNLSTNGGQSFTSIDHVSGSGRSYFWSVPPDLPGASNVTIQIVATDTAGLKTTATSGAFAVRGSGPTIKGFTLQRGATSLSKINAGTDDLSLILSGIGILNGAQAMVTDSTNGQTQILNGVVANGSLTVTLSKLLIAQTKTLSVRIINPGTAPSLPIAVTVNGPSIQLIGAAKVFNNSVLIGYDIKINGKNLTPADLPALNPAAIVTNGSTPVAISQIVVGNNSLTLQIRTTFTPPTKLTVRAGYNGVTGTPVLTSPESVKIP